MAALTDTYRAIADVSSPFTSPASSALAGLGDHELMAAQATVAEIRRRCDAVAASIARELAHRSRRELGQDGLAQRLGQRTAENLVQKIAGTTAEEARSFVQAGALLPIDAPEGAAGDREPLPPTPSWLVAVGEALAAARISLPAADAIRTGIGVESEAVSAGELGVAVATLLREAPGLTVERLGRRARELRAELDLAGVRQREEQLFQRRYLRFVKQGDGMTRVHGLLDPETAATVIPILDAITSPRRGGPRFVDPDAVERAERLVRDERTIDQITLDAFSELIRIGAAVDDGTIVGSRKPKTRLLVTKRDLVAGSGFAFFEGQTEPVSIETAERHICAEGFLPILFDDDGRALNRGRTQRLFSEKQKDVIAARDGGCIFGDCERPPSWSEAHHINEFERDYGLTDVDDGVCLCRYHHLLLHNRGWRIIRRGGDYYLIPPPEIDPEQRPIPTRKKSPALRRLLATA